MLGNYLIRSTRFVLFSLDKVESVLGIIFLSMIIVTDIITVWGPLSARGVVILWGFYLN